LFTEKYQKRTKSRNDDNERFCIHAIQKPPSHHRPKNQPFLTATLVYLFTA